MSFIIWRSFSHWLFLQLTRSGVWDILLKLDPLHGDGVYSQLNDMKHSKVLKRLLGR